MLYLVLLLLIAGGCAGKASPPAVEVADDARRGTMTAPIADLEFDDDGLQAIAANVVSRARDRGIDSSAGRNRIERLLSLEASLGESTLALERTNALVARLTTTDASQWAKLRHQAARELGGRDDEVSRRVTDLLARWQRRKTECAFDYLSANYGKGHITSLEWEKRFHDFVAERPLDAATWGWLVLRAYASEARQQYGRADTESAYRFYLEYSGLGDGREARRIFSVPGIDVIESR